MKTRCYRCGVVIPVEYAVRRDMVVASSYTSGGTWDRQGAHPWSGSTSITQLVDVCERCHRRLTQQEEAAERAKFVAVLVVLVLMAVGVLLVLLFAVYGGAGALPRGH
jgi:hypothetical protein